MAKRIYVRRLRNQHLHRGYIPVGAFGGEVIPKRLFLCIWPSDPNVKERAILKIQRKQDGSSAHELCLNAIKEPPKSQYILKFDKTAKVFDHEGFFWTASKGHNFQIEGHVEGESIVFRCNNLNKNRYFADMLSVIGERCKNTNISLIEYMEKQFEAVVKNTYSFAVYLNVKFWSDTVKFKNSEEKIYRFSLPQEILGNIAIYSVLYEYSSLSDNSLKKKLPSSATIVDPNAMSKVYETPQCSANDLKIDITNVLKECITPFIKNFKDKEPTDKDYSLLVNEMLENLAKVHKSE